MQVTAFVDLTNRRLTSTLGGGSLTLPDLVQGDEIRMGLRFIEQIDGTATEVVRNLHSLRASIGFVDARPTGGTFQLHVDGDAVGSPLAFNATAAQVQAVLDTAYTSSVTVTAKDGSWLVDIADAIEANYEITGTTVNLEPSTYVRVRSYPVGTKNRHEIRLIRLPLASTSSFESILPQKPEVVRIQGGGEGSLASKPDEIQALKVNPFFKGTYQLRLGFKRSQMLSVEDDIETIEKRIAFLAEPGGTLTVTNPADNTAYITFGGTMKETPQELMQVEVFSAPPGDPTFVLNLNTAEMADALRAVDNITTAVLEVEMIINDENHPDVLYTITPIRLPVRIIRELNWEGLEAAANINWLRPPHGRTYLPFTEDQIITGSQHYVAPIGDGTHTNYTLTHNLGTRDLHVTLRNNDGESAIVDRQFSLDGDDLYISYAVTLDSEDELTIKFKTPPTANQYVATITTAGPISAFLAHTHTLNQIVGLDPILSEIDRRVDVIERLIPTTGILTKDEKQTTVASWELPKIFEVFPTRATIDAEDVVSVELDKLPRNGGLLPAKHLTGSLTVANTIPTSPSQSAVYHYTDTTKELAIPGYLGRKGKNITAPAFYAWDGRGFYQVEKVIDSETVYYPADFSRELFRIHVNEKQLRFGETFSLDFSFVAAVFNSNTSVHWGIVIDIGIPQGSPTTPSNISVVNFLPPSLDHSFMLTSVPSAHSFGLRVSRRIADELPVYKVDRVLYGATEVSDTALTTANFIVRGRLARFDTDNNSPDPRGLVAFNGMDATLEGEETSSEKKYGIAKI